MMVVPDADKDLVIQTRHRRRAHRATGAPSATARSSSPPSTRSTPSAPASRRPRQAPKRWRYERSHGDHQDEQDQPDEERRSPTRAYRPCTQGSAWAGARALWTSTCCKGAEAGFEEAIALLGNCSEADPQTDDLDRRARQARRAHGRRPSSRPTGRARRATARYSSCPSPTPSASGRGKRAMKLWMRYERHPIEEGPMLRTTEGKRDGG